MTSATYHMPGTFIDSPVSSYASSLSRESTLDERQFVETALALNTSSYLPHVSNGFIDAKMPSLLQSQTDKHPLAHEPPAAPPQFTLGAAFNVSSIPPFVANANTTIGRTPFSLALQNPSSTTTATTSSSSSAFAPPLTDYSTFTGSYASLLSASSMSTSDSVSSISHGHDDADRLSDEAIEDSDDDDLPALSLFRNHDGTLGIDALADTQDTQSIVDAAQWADVPAPAALLEEPELGGIDGETAPNLLRAILQSSVESVQARAPLFKAAVASLKDSREQLQLQQEQGDQDNQDRDDGDDDRDSRNRKGKEVMTSSTATLRPPHVPVVAPQTQPKMSKRQMFASRFRRLRGNSTAGNGESSAQGAAAASEAALQRQSQWVSSAPGIAPISEGRRKIMLLAMVQQSMAKKKDAVPPQTVECISCFEDIPVQQAVKTVCHSYCLDCFAQLVATAVTNEAQFPPKCCLNEIPSATVNRYAPRDVARRYAGKRDELAVPVADRIYCPTVDCGVFVPQNQVSTAARTAHCRNGHETCTACRQPTHGPGNRDACPEAAAQDRRDQQLADSLADDEGWRRCIDCTVLIEHSEACQHMTCRCGAQFCYVCGARWRTCTCSMDDLRARKNGAADRREARARREQHAQELAAQADRELLEVRDALRQVAEFERRETERLAADRAVQRERLQDLVRRREAVLRVETDSKYAALLVSLAALTQAQLQRARQTRRSERVAQRAMHIRERRQLAQEHADERAAAAATAAKTIRDADAVWTVDYRERCALEERLEAHYTRQVEAAGTEGTDAQAALRAYQRQNDSQLDDYLRWMEREKAQIRFDAEETRDVGSEVLDSLMRKYVRTQRAETRALAQKHRAERVWCGIVATERERLLAEANEVERGLGLAGSSSDMDAQLLLLLEMDANGALEPNLETGAENNQMYAVMLNNMAGQHDGFV